MALHCGMTKDCARPVTHVDNRGFVYCERHGLIRKPDTPTRKLRPAEIKKLEGGGTIRYSRKG